MEKETKNQIESHLWHVEKQKLLTGSNSGKICKNPHTSSKNTVYSLLYVNNIHAKALDYGRNTEQYAIHEFETKFGLNFFSAC